MVLSLKDKLSLIKIQFLYNKKYKIKRRTMPYKVGKKTKTKGWPILECKNGKWFVIAHSDQKSKAEASIRARRAHLGSKKA